MTQAHNPSQDGTPVQPTLNKLMAHYLQQQAVAHDAGLATAEPLGEVLPYNAGPVQPVDPRPAWEEAVAAARCLSAVAEMRSWQAPPSWAQLVAAHEPAAALAFCFGNFPQLVRNLHLLTEKVHLSELRPTADQPLTVPSLLAWADQAAPKRQYPEVLLAIGALRLAKHFDRAAELLQALEASVPAEWRDALANEKAALAWHSGRWEEARALWQALPPSIPVLFNRGMSALFSNERQEARTALGQAVAGLPEAGAWHHLGRLYLALTEMQQ